MPSCSIINCKKTTKLQSQDKDISFHRFPDDPAMKDLWVQATGRKNWSPTIHSRICSSHFLEHMFTCNTGVAVTKYRRLYNNAIPTIDVVKISNDDQVDFIPNYRTYTYTPVPSTAPSTSKTETSSSEDTSSSESETDKVIVKEEPEDTYCEEEHLLEEIETEANKSKLEEEITIEKTETHERLPETCNNVECCDGNDETVLIQQDFLKTIYEAQTDVLNTLKSQVLLQDPDPELFTFLRFLGAKLEMLPVQKRRHFQDKVKALVLEEYFDG